MPYQPYRANTPLEVEDLRGQRENELEIAAANGDERASRLLMLLQGQMDNDPYTGTAAHTRVNKIQGAVDDANTYQRPDVTEARQGQQLYDLLKVGEPARVAGSAGNERERITQAGQLQTQLAENEGIVAASRNRAGGGVHPLASGLLERVAGGSNSLAGMQRLLGMKGDVSTGPLAGRLQSLSQIVPGFATSGKFASFKAESDALTNSTIKAITGAQMSEPEAVRIMGQIPSVNDKGTVWSAKMTALDRSIRGLNIRIGLLQQGVPAEMLDGIPIDELQDRFQELEQPGGGF